MYVFFGPQKHNHLEFKVLLIPVDHIPVELALISVGSDRFHLGN